MNIKTLFITVILLVIIHTGYATDALREDKTVRNIRYEGLKLTALGTIKRYVHFKSSDTIDEDDLEDVREKLLDTGIFTTVDITAQPVVDKDSGEPLAYLVDVVITVDEKPRVRNIVIEGNKFMFPGAVKEECLTKEYGVLNEEQIKADVERIKNRYKKHGFSLISITYELLENENTAKFNVYDLHFIIDEGPRALVHEIIIQGNTVYPAARLKKQMKTKDASSIFGVFQIYNEQQYQADVNTVAGYYHNTGYINATVTGEVEWRDVFLFNKMTKKIFITLTVTEGEHYTYDTLTINGNTVYTDKELHRLLFLKKGESFNAGKFNDFINTVNELYQETDRPETTIEAEKVIDEDKRTVSYDLTITESEQSYVEAVYIQGIKKTRKYALERLIRNKPGELYSHNKVRDTIEILNDLKYIEVIRYEVTPGSAPGLVAVTYYVKETGSIEVYVTFGTGDANYWPPDASVGAKFIEHNLAGRQIVNTNELRTSLYHQVLDIEMEDPHFLNSPFSLGASVGFKHAWNIWVLREVAHEVADHTDDGVYSEQDLREYYHKNADGIENNKNYLGSNGDLFNMGVHEIMFELGLKGKYHFLKYFSVGLEYFFTPDYITLPISKQHPAWNDRVDEIDASMRFLKDYLNEGWIIKSKIAAPFMIDTTKGLFYPKEGVKFTVTPAYVWGHFDAFLLNTQCTYYLKLLELDFQDYPFHPVLVFNAGARFIFPGFLNLDGTLYGRPTAGKGPIVDYAESLLVDGITTGRGWNNSIGAQSRMDRFIDKFGFARFDASIELRIPIYEKIIWLATFVDMVNLVIGPIDFEKENPYRDIWRWWDKHEWWGADNWYGSIGAGFQLVLKEFPLSFYVVKRFKVNYYSGIEWTSNEPQTGNIDFIISITGHYF